jgi:hypothetical protein
MVISLGGCHLYFSDNDDDYEEECWWDECNGNGPTTRLPDAGGGWECDSNDQCAAGCYCANGWCEETGFCDQYTTCTDGLTCDDRGTCVPEAEPAVTCQGDVFCDVEAPICPAGSTPAIEFGCYTGQCMDKDDCPDGAPFACSDFDGLEQTCISSLICEPIYKGVNCTSNDGSACTAGDVDCTCESFEYDRCDSVDAPVN